MSEVVTFYTHVADADLFACRLSKRAADSGKRVLIWLPDTERMAKMDTLLWTYEAESFLPHRHWQNTPDDGDSVPVCLAAETDFPQLPPDWVVLNLSDDLLHTATRPPSRILEIVGPQSHQLAAARERFAAYRRAGRTVEHHNMQGKA